MTSVLRQKAQETADERQHRNAASFPSVEKKLPLRWYQRSNGIIDFVSSMLGQRNPLAQPASPRENIVWLLDNTAYRPVRKGTRDAQPWHAEMIACVFVAGDREDVGKFVASLADAIGLDGELGKDETVKRRIRERVQPFLNKISPSRSVTIEIPVPNGEKRQHKLGPTNDNGIASQTLPIGGHNIRNGAVVKPYLKGWDDMVSMETRFASPEGWLVISDIDDTIKYTQTSEPTGILRTTFAEEPRAIPGMPQFYSHVQKHLVPTWFYLSASPYNLYPFLRQFLRSNYSPGTLILRDFSWMDLGGLLKSFTQGTQAYKVDRMEKIHQWLPWRQVLCVGDSTQSDPEAYAEIYKKYPGWIQAILIRKVTDIAHMEKKNSDERFQDAFKGIPQHVWTVFEKPEELHRLVDRLK
ncbi:hypothetical protein Plec18167_000100 [Paecilomyces lecythidis]|uniref:Phosphatidate phosphatase APP1 catalytic domain-containing protein n=1 Tax=Paecilomyces lecythidis TaxID=3004212 RepID=A0ABR3YCY0_9EURO